MNNEDKAMLAAIATLSASLTEGAPLTVEDLDLSGLGLYTDEQRIAALQAGGVDDYFKYYIMGGWTWMRKSEEGVKWHTYKDSGTIAPWKK